MSFYNGGLKTIDLCKMFEDIRNEFLVKSVKNGISEEFSKSSRKEMLHNLKEQGEIYYSFARREGKYLLCANGKKLEIDDDRSKISQGIYMADAYFNQYDDINLGFLISYNEEKIEIKPAIEGESTGCRRYEVIENCGDLNKEMKNFLQLYMM
ncbi:MAG: hypothetical protein RSG52_04135 [Terrisporobacter sp.]|uniref:hypothetical protein n=1 Tax=Terrisporobacter sp. TaxID=1965305 RepID=UPI002FCC5FB4